MVVNNPRELFSKLPNSARFVLTFLETKHLIHGVNYLTFQDLVDGTGLSPRTLRKILPILKDLGFIHVLVDSSTYRRYLYRLNFKNLPCDKSIERGIYLIDIGVGTSRYLNLKTIQVIRQSDVIMYTDAVPERILEYSSSKCKLIKLENLEVNSIIDLITKFIQENDVITLIYDMLYDGSINIDKNSIPYEDVKIFNISCTSPITIAVQLYYHGKNVIKFKRNNLILEIRRKIEDLNYEIFNSIVKIFKVKVLGNAIEIKSINLNEIINEENTVYILYRKISS